MTLSFSIASDLYLVSKPAGSAHRIEELSCVRLREPLTTDEGLLISTDLIGTVVGVWGGGAAFDVEFVEPVGALVTVKASAVRLV